MGSEGSCKVIKEVQEKVSFGMSLGHDKYDKDAIQHGKSNKYTLMHKKNKIVFASFYSY